MTLPTAPPGSRRNLASIGTAIADLTSRYRLLGDAAREHAAEAKRDRPVNPAVVAHWEQVADRAEHLHALTLAMARTHADLDIVVLTGALSSVVNVRPGTMAADVANASLDADESEAALLLAHADVMREKDPEPEEEPGDVAPLTEYPKGTLAEIGKRLRSW